MREVFVEDQTPIIEFCHQLVTGQIDVVIFLTGVGARDLIQRGIRLVPRQRFLDSLADVTTILRGPKPVAVFRDFALQPSYIANQPHTWRDILKVVDEHLTVTNLNVAIQEHGAPSVSLSAGLEARGATLHSIKTYEWGLPADIGPLVENAQRIADGKIDFAVFTSAQQIVNLLQAAEQQSLAESLRNGLSQTVVASVGPTTSEALTAAGISVDFEPSHSKLGQLISQLAVRSADLVQSKRIVRSDATSTNTMNPSAAPPWHNSAFLRACRGETTDFTPIWLMRQAGRYMSEYRAVRAERSFLELCKNPQLCSEVMCTAVQKLGVDAGIIFSDLLPILEPMGLRLEFTQGDGPRILNPIRDAVDVSRVVPLADMDSLSFVVETAEATRRDLPEQIPLIGFAGAPFTLASYAIEGGSSRTFVHTKTLMYREPSAWHDLMQRLSVSIVRYLNAQIAAGVQAVQLFDSWVGCLGPSDYREYVLPHVQAIANEIQPTAPLIHFATGNPALLPLLAEAGGSVIGIDWRIGLADAWQSVGHHRAVQGNLDPTVLFADRETIRAQVKSVLGDADGRAGHIFNLGHGVLPQTPVDHARAVVDMVHEESSR